ncbi:class I SAM-dependent methyltransferase [Candidatus Woesearchaeota archaeon]|nr:class I SAM-dependent methyltransferase [Candidatus Woesearchaeota archaeon]
MVEHYFSEKPSSKYNLLQFECTIRGIHLRFFSSHSTFSVGKLDRGTKLLAESMEVENALSILDMGCGIGILGIVCSKLNPAASIMMVDVNERSIALAEKNARLNRCSNTTIFKSDLYEAFDNKFDVIVSNPPQKAGKEVCFGMIEDSILHLNNGGSLQIVARHNKGGKELEKKMKEVFGNVAALAKESGYRVYKSIKS